MRFLIFVVAEIIACEQEVKFQMLGGREEKEREGERREREQERGGHVEMNYFGNLIKVQ